MHTHTYTRVFWCTHVILAFQEEKDVGKDESQTQVYPGLQNEFKTSLGNLMRPCLKTERKKRLHSYNPNIQHKTGRAERLTESRSSQSAIPRLTSNLHSYTRVYTHTHREQQHSSTSTPTYTHKQVGGNQLTERRVPMASLRKPWLHFSISKKRGGRSGCGGRYL